MISAIGSDVATWHPPPPSYEMHGRTHARPRHPDPHSVAFAVVRIVGVDGTEPPTASVDEEHGAAERAVGDEWQGVRVRLAPAAIAEAVVACGWRRRCQ